MENLTELFCKVDDFCLDFLPQWHAQLLASKQRKRIRSHRMSLSEMMTILISFHTSHHIDFKDFYINVIGKFYTKEFPSLYSYQRFIELEPLCLVPLTAFVAQVKGKSTGISFVDSTSIKVCHNKRIPRHKTFKDTASRSKNSMGWFYGFKLHLIVNHLGEIIEAKFTTANTDDRKPIPEMIKDVQGKLYGDKGYLGKEFAQTLAEQGITMVTNVRKNMKAKALALWDKAMLARRCIIETINGQLKNISQIEHSRHRSENGLMINIISGLIAYCLKPDKPSSQITSLEKDAMMALT